MIVECKTGRRLAFHDFFLFGTALEVCNEIKHLGHHITSDLIGSVPSYTHKQICWLVNLVTFLFKAFCSPF